MGHKEATNGEPGLVVETTTPLTPWEQRGEPGLVIEVTTPLTS